VLTTICGRSTTAGTDTGPTETENLEEPVEAGALEEPVEAGALEEPVEAGAMAPSV
jgi:hypothetical protein